MDLKKKKKKPQQEQGNYLSAEPPKLLLDPAWRGTYAEDRCTIDRRREIESSKRFRVSNSSRRASGAEEEEGQPAVDAGDKT